VNVHRKIGPSVSDFFVQGNLFTLKKIALLPTLAQTKTNEFPSPGKFSIRPVTYIESFTWSTIREDNGAIFKHLTAKPIQKSLETRNYM
jgi:hypothetical protein